MLSAGFFSNQSDCLHHLTAACSSGKARLLAIIAGALGREADQDCPAAVQGETSCLTTKQQEWDCRGAVQTAVLLVIRLLGGFFRVQGQGLACLPVACNSVMCSLS